MYLTRIIKKRLASDSSGERGVALIAVVGVLGVLVIVSSVVLTSSTSAAGFATSTRAQVQSTAAANAGIEAARAKMLSGVFSCSVTSAAGASPDYSAAITYTSSTGAAISCPAGGVASATPASAVIISTGYADSVAVAGVSDNSTAQLGANVAIQVTPGGASLTDAVFTDGAMNLNNGDTINQSASGALDANIYSNGAITCPANGVVDGTIYSQGSLTFSNSNCISYGTVWVKGNVSTASVTAVFKGSIYATGTVSTGNSPVSGSIIASGAITLGQPNAACATGGVNANVCGSVYSLGSSVTTNQNGSKVLGSIYARGAVAGGNSSGGSTSVGQDVISLSGGVTGYLTAAGNLISGGTIASTAKGTTSHCSGSSCKLILPLTTAAAPAFAVQLPMFSSTSGGNLGTTSSTITVVPPPAQYLPQVPTGTASWVANGWRTYAAPSSWCSTQNSAIGTDVSGIYSNYPAGTSLLIDFSACSSAVSVSGSAAIAMSTAKVTNVAFYLPHGISIQNNLSMSSTDSNQHVLYLVSPSNASGVTWSGTNAATPTCTGSGPNISISSQLTATQDTQLFVYTPCTFTLQNGGTFTGQIYSGASSWPNNMSLTMPAAGSLAVVPGLTIPGGTSSSATYSAVVTSRYVVNG